MNRKTGLKIGFIISAVILLAVSSSTYALNYMRKATQRYHHNSSQFQTNLKKARSVASLCRAQVNLKLLDKGYSRPEFHNNINGSQANSFKEYIQKSNTLQDECHERNGYDLYVEGHHYYLGESKKIKSRIGKLGARWL
ncbi:hypothetical protein [Vibrio algarum]|uniref:DUF3718 domain-containing protein n=1 Tax=Vibrio algarum TaxID=3020714 RepID=A0ABT4YW02_9VIBR|nr:hypothetical protein [Vibrio sp. KJ40-1]MDB1125567.1 hypothetical protein [Vibrio sp. KJ40-1]